MLAISAFDGTRAIQRTQAFTKASGQNQLVLTPPPVADNAAMTATP
jgi:hypothetical protein